MSEQTPKLRSETIISFKASITISRALPPDDPMIMNHIKALQKLGVVFEYNDVYVSCKHYKNDALHKQNGDARIHLEK